MNSAAIPLAQSARSILRCGNCAPYLANAVYIGLPVAMTAWLLVDPLAIDVFRLLIRHEALVAPIQTIKTLLASVGFARVAAVGFGAAALLIGLVFDWKRSLSRSGKPLTIRHLLFLTTMLACGLGIILGAERLAWFGKTLRLNPRVDRMELLAEQLQNDWPTEDGEIAGLGPFNSYPFGEPSMLLLLTPFPLEGSDTVISAIGRSGDTLRFQLGGVDGGDWIEWHPKYERPQSFTGGLSDRHRLQQCAPLRPRWYLVRYHNGSPSTDMR